MEIPSPQATVYSAVPAASFDDIPRRLVEALTMPVHWRETMLALNEQGVARFVEVGRGKC
jgi:malonyl CoA-acyl carrier protein transacylase